MKQRDTASTMTPTGDEVLAALLRLLDAVSDAVLVVDRHGAVVARNPRFRETFAPATEPSLSARCPNAGRCADNGPSAPRCLLCEVAEAKQSRRTFEVAPDADGQQRRWEVTLGPVLGSDGEVTVIVQAWRDVTEHSTLEAQLSHSERLASLGMLAAGVAHEVNNPLASILAGVESLQRWAGRVKLPAADLADVTEVLGLLEQETRRCRETTDRLLLLAQPYASKPVWVDLNRAVTDTLSLLAFATRRQGIEVATHLEAGLPPVWGREGGLRGVVMNLCMNAVQAMPSGGRLVVRTSAAGAERVQLEVVDDGPGIAPEHLGRIWDPFFTTKPVGQGTGLGLSITQRAVDRHGGRVEVESTPGAGARFIVTLPTQGSGGESV